MYTGNSSRICFNCSSTDNVQYHGSHRLCGNCAHNAHKVIDSMIKNETLSRVRGRD